MKLRYLYFILLSLSSFSLWAQKKIINLPPQGGGEFVFEQYDKCLSDEERTAIWEELHENMDQLRAEGKLRPANSRMIVNFDWPLQGAAGLNFDDFDAISNYVDQSPTTSIEDYNCGTRSYDGHRGIDIFTWPFPWYLYDNDLVEVVAGEAGTIVNKFDGNDDDHCSCFGSWNAVYISHADGSTAWYGHLKRNSLTTKNIGQTVSKGEYLGVVASSGCSTGPHLHLEVYDNGGNLIEPYQGPCNGLNTDSWWASQENYREPTVNAVLTHDAAPVQSCPGANEDPHFANSFTPGETVYTGFYYRDQGIGMTSTHRILRPNNTVWQTWNSTASTTYSASWWWWSWNLPVGGPFGTWKVEVDFNGVTSQHTFTYSAVPLPVELLSFTGIAIENREVRLDWRTTSEIDNIGFELEHSRDGKVWEKIQFIQGHGTVNSAQVYSYLHENPYRVENFYRLKQMDTNGNYEYSDIINVTLKDSRKMVLIPNPVENATVTVGGLGLDGALVKIFDVTGKLIITKWLDQRTINISELATGLYLVSVLTENEVLTQRMVVK